jgi:MFS family permease
MTGVPAIAERPRHILPSIMISQFAGTSLWFAGNAVLPDLERQWGLSSAAVGDITTAVQLGFIAGTLTFAISALSDRFSPRLIFCACAVLGAASNAAAVLLDAQLWALLALRFATGFFLAGIYPVGMKIASGWYQRDLGRALGYLVGALVAGTALPHLVRGMGQTLPWEGVTLAVSGFVLAGGLLMLTLVPDGPHLVSGARFDPRALASVFRSPRFRASAFGYFGHMWELYAFWAFVPILLMARADVRESGLNISLWSFVIIGIGCISCMVGGVLSGRFGSGRVAFAQLMTSGACCVVSPLLFDAPLPVLLAFLVIWGVAVVGDSPQFSALNARFAPRQLVGSALTIANAIGFGISIVSIQLLNFASAALDVRYLFVLLAPGPIFGLLSLVPLIRSGGDLE